MINVGTDVTNIINDSAYSQINTVKQQSITHITKSWKKVAVVEKESSQNKNTIASVLSKANQSAIKMTNEPVTETISTASKTIQNTIDNIKIEDMVKKVLSDGENNLSLSELTDSTLKNSVDSMLKNQIKDGTLSLNTNDLDKTYATVTAYYKKLYDDSLVMKQLRNKTEENISNTINKAINDKLFSWQNELLGQQKNILNQSKLMTTLNTFVTQETKKCIEGILDDTIAKNQNEIIVNNLKTIQGSIQKQFETTLKTGIEQYQKLRQVIAEKIKVYQEMKQKFEQHIASIVNGFKEKIANAIQDVTKKITDAIGGSVKAAVANITL